MSPNTYASLKSYVDPFRVDGSKEFHLKAHDPGQKSGLHKDTGKQLIEANRGRCA